MSEKLTLDELRVRIQKAEKNHLLRKSLTKYSPDIIEQYKKLFKDQQDYYELKQKLGAIDIEHLKSLWKQDKVLGSVRPHRVFQSRDTDSDNTSVTDEELIKQNVVIGDGLIDRAYTAAISMAKAVGTLAIATVALGSGSNYSEEYTEVLEKCRVEFYNTMRDIEFYHLKEVQNAKSS